MDNHFKPHQILWKVSALSKLKFKLFTSKLTNPTGQFHCSYILALTVVSTALGYKKFISVTKVIKLF